MQPRFSLFAQALRSSRSWTRPVRPILRPRAVPFVCRGCQSKFSTSTILRRVAHASKLAFRNAARKAGYATEAGKPLNRYPETLLIYDAGDMRSAFVTVWKILAMFEATVVVTILAPIQYHNENQPNPNLRLFYAVGLTVLGCVPFCLLSYLTAPFVKHVHIRLPVRATRSLARLQQFAMNPPPDTRLEFTTLRAVGFKRHTAVLLHELRALPASRWGFANIERIKSDYLLKDEKSKGIFRKILTVLNEPRFKFYVKEGRIYTIKTKVPGVWESIAAHIRRQTDEIARKAKGPGRKILQARKPTAKIEKVEVKPLKRQTSRLTR
ncbi:hypothetical protein K491DRAFT_429193 [Lophiostoma macrostomum CBS 122681]|uniref:Uncharacterized protein n=1 Tax=Lophiostoma macrostomum CBS 122681 TaxID=1314788 RepID=A0A6A6T728_9PLEO|nr:hypothetical protein K491DRAFT_429193 [Lophiostoma macrostomum CBS 122681]